MMNGMNKVLRDFILEKTMPFLDDVFIKGCREESKDETLDKKGCRKYVVDYIEDYKKILTWLGKVHLTLLGMKSVFGVQEVVIVGHLCGSYGRKLDPTKVDAIGRIREDCDSLTEVRRFLGACVFYRIWIPHYAHIADPLYGLLRKGCRFKWEEKHIQAMQTLKKLLVPPLG